MDQTLSGTGQGHLWAPTSTTGSYPLDWHSTGRSPFFHRQLRHSLAHWDQDKRASMVLLAWTLL